MFSNLFGSFQTNLNKIQTHIKRWEFKCNKIETFKIIFDSMTRIWKISIILYHISERNIGECILLKSKTVIVINTINLILNELSAKPIITLYIALLLFMMLFLFDWTILSAPPSQCIPWSGFCSKTVFLYFVLLPWYFGSWHHDRFIATIFLGEG